MKHSKMHLFGIWLLIVALVFGSVPFNSTYADPSAKKDVSNRFVFDSGINVTYEGNKQQQIPIYTDGNLVGNDTLTEGKKITIKYIWGIPEENFNGTAAGLDGTAIKPGDTFLIELPDNNHLKFNQFTEYKPLGEYGSWRIINKNVGGKNVQYIDGFFNEKVGEMSGGEYVGGLQKGFFEIIAGTYGDGTVNLNLNKTEPPINLKIVPYLDVPLWNPGPFYKQASVHRTDGYITWSLITGFDNLKYAYEQGKFLKNGKPTSVPSDKEAMVVIDRFPLDLDIAAIEFKVPIYFPTPTDNSLNAGLDPTDANYIQPGQLSWRSRHLIYQEFKPSDSVVVQGNGDEAGLQTFIAEIREKGRNSADGIPVIGFYRTETEQVVVVGLGDSPNAKLTYEDYYLVGRGKYFPATLKDAIDDYRTSGKIDDLQYEIMKRVYLNNSKILAWSIGIRVNVNPNITKTYINNGEFRYRTGGPGGGEEVPVFNKIEANFLRVNAGVEPFKRLSFPVEKKWIDKNGSPFNPTDRDSIQVDVYKIVGGSEILLPGHSILLTKDNNWKKSITGLPIFDDEGNRIQ
ncbi:MAG: Cna B-type domain-containing protein, partial [Bacillota bacterium]|nr:Cna B-type domain-containing protein [Bacillota bacterium]